MSPDELDILSYQLCDYKTVPTEKLPEFDGDLTGLAPYGIYAYAW